MPERSRLEEPLVECCVCCGWEAAAAAAAQAAVSRLHWWRPEGDKGGERLQQQSADRAGDHCCSKEDLEQKPWYYFLFLVGSTSFF